MEQVKRSADADCGLQMMRRGYLAMKNGSWDDFEERYRKEGTSEWTFERIREACEKVAKDEVGRLGIAQEILRKSTDFLRRIIAPVDGMESRCRLLVRIVTASRFRTTFDEFLQGTATAATERRSTATGGVRLVEAHTTGERPTGYWCVQLGVNATDAKVFRAHAAPFEAVRQPDRCAQAAGEQSIKNGDSPIQSIVTGLHERSRKGIMEGLRSFIKEDN